MLEQNRRERERENARPARAAVLSCRVVSVRVLSSVFEEQNGHRGELVSVFKRCERENVFLEIAPVVVMVVAVFALPESEVEASWAEPIATTTTTSIIIGGGGV